MDISAMGPKDIPGLFDAKVVGPDGTELPHDGVSQGEVLMRGPWIIERYHKMEDKGGAFADGWWRSGDAGTIRPDGYLKLTDRIKDVIKTGGEWLSSLTLEGLISRHEAVRDVAVVGVPDERWGERPFALVVLGEGQELNAEQLRNFLEPAVAEGHINKWAIPQQIAVVTEIPKTSVGKLDKKRIRSELARWQTEGVAQQASR